MVAVGERLVAIDLPLALGDVDKDLEFAGDIVSSPFCGAGTSMSQISMGVVVVLHGNPQSITFFHDVDTLRVCVDS